MFLFCWTRIKENKGQEKYQKSKAKISWLHLLSENSYYSEKILQKANFLKNIDRQ